MNRLISVYKAKDAKAILYKLLKERSKNINISHRCMPSMKEHIKFIASRPYKSWDLIMINNKVVGSVYLSKQNEIGLFISKKNQGFGCGKKALELILKKHARVDRFLANINPKNKRSIDFFMKAGFCHIQNTYELRKGKNI